jgi:hypothetical protein
MKTIELTKGKVAIVDDEDYEGLASVRWHTSNSGYAKRNNPISQREILGFCEFMHRRIMGLPGKSKLEVDHINGDPLDNRKANLRICTHAENLRNQKMKKHNRSGLKGVHFHKQSGRWRSIIKVEGKSISLGLFETKDLAHQAYCDAAKRFFGEFANFGVAS